MSLELERELADALERLQAYELPGLISAVQKVQELKRELALAEATTVAADDLRRFSEWDVLNLPAGNGDDGPYWQGEIAKVRAELALRRPEGAAS